jgi:sugar phosphate isomerase/epimerase
MEISISTSFNYSISIYEQVKLLKKHKINYISLGTDYKHSGIINNDGIKGLIELLKTNNVRIDTIHGYNLDKVDTIEVNEKIFESANKLSVPIVVLHCSSFMIKENTFEDRKIDILNKIKVLESFYDKYGIRIAFENLMPGITTDLLKYALDNTNGKIFGFCYDSAHDQIDGPNPFDLLRDNREKIIALHLSDRIKEFVDHVVPGEGFIDFNEIIKILSKTKYNSPLLMEVMMNHSKYKDPEIFLEKTIENGQKIIDSINQMRNIKDGQNFA